MPSISFSARLSRALLCQARILLNENKERGKLIGSASCANISARGEYCAPGPFALCSRARASGASISLDSVAAVDRASSLIKNNNGRGRVCQARWISDFFFSFLFLLFKRVLVELFAVLFSLSVWS